MEHYDVVVVGGGPAGATAAAQLRTWEYDVCVLDAAAFPREKLCGGLITHKTLELVERVFGVSRRSLLEEGVLDHRSSEYEVCFETDRLARVSLDEPFFFAKRTTYDHRLVREAADRGAALYDGEAVTGIDAAASTVSTETGRTVEARYVIGADGANSFVRQSLVDAGEVETPDWRRNLAMGVETFVPRAAVELAVDHPLLHFGVVNWGYGWVFPNADRYAIGVGGLLRENERFDALLDGYLSQLSIDPDDRSQSGHPIPFGNYLPSPHAGSVLLTGDAAGLVDPITGEGIFYAQRSGELAAWAIHAAERDDARASAGRRYEALLSSRVLPELRVARRTRPCLWAGPALPRRLALRAWFRLLGAHTGELINGIRRYEYLKRSGESFHAWTPDDVE